MQPSGSQNLGFWFGEDQARYVITTKDSDKIIKLAKNNNIQAVLIGKTQEKYLSINGENLPVEQLKETNENWLPEYMGSAQT